MIFISKRVRKLSSVNEHLDEKKKTKRKNERAACVLLGKRADNMGTYRTHQAVAASGAFKTRQRALFMLNITERALSREIYLTD